MSDASSTPLNILVLVKHVPDAQFDRHIDLDTLRIDRSESILSELDEYAVEAALAIAEDRGGPKAGNQVIAATMGGPKAVASVKKALQMGATSGLHLNDEALAGSDAVATANALAALIKYAGDIDLVVTGMASTDAETGIVPAQLAELLGFAALTNASNVDFDSASGTLSITRDHGADSLTLRGSLPAVLSVTDQANEPRYPNFRGIMAAKKKKVEEVSAADLGLDASSVGPAGSPTRVLSANARPARGAGTVITDNGQAGIALVDYLAEQKLI
ncbi:electron transfer flavoprotein subunit beta/FixA family protein [Glutamicibacter sp. V16R2B1]|uniref:electron transfer flavoprotein subunit beta/FixA family protein n=1 Tax=Glutamicibacter sp. V16R2B1 TaxID=2036207 RepID=UPI0014854633|nr:electron transfer flavoprotein subunit beta/FixA family protein [Glutamicibacter sp. V16R2B1]